MGLLLSAELAVAAAIILTIVLQLHLLTDHPQQLVLHAKGLLFDSLARIAEFLRTHILAQLKSRVSTQRLRLASNSHLAFLRIGGEHFRKRLLAVAAIALFLRLLVVLIVSDVGVLQSDEAAYATMARAFSESRSIENYNYPPGYPAMLGIMLDVVGEDIPDDRFRAWVGVVQALLGASVVLLVGVIGARRIDESTGLVAAGLMAIWPNQVLATSVVMSELLFTSILVLGTTLVLWNRHPGYIAILAAAMIFSLAVLIRPSCWPIVPALMIIAASRSGTTTTNRGGRWRSVLVSIGGVTLVAVALLWPWATHVHSRTGSFDLTERSGLNLCVGNSPSATGRWFDNSPDCPLNETSSVLRSKAADWIIENPTRFFSLVPERLRATMESDNYSIYWYVSDPDARISSSSRYALVVAIAISLFWPLMLLLGLAGTVLARFKEVRLTAFTLAIAVLVMPLVSFGVPRYHDPIVPFVALAAACTVMKVIDKVRSHFTSLGVGPSDISLPSRRVQPPTGPPRW